MARGSTRARKNAHADRPGVDDPTAPLDGGELLTAARPVLSQLRTDLEERATDPGVAQALEGRYKDEKERKLTGDSFAAWREARVAQIAASWFLSCVFVRTLEDRGLLGQARLAGPGALDSQAMFFQLAPSLTERDYLLFVFRELAELPASRALFDREHALVWQLSPSADAAKELLRLFRTPTAEAPAFRFGQASTRFLGDLYQDLYEDVRKRFALLQTPDFVERFILDRTLEPAIERFGLDDTTLIDPTCGSGHFLLGAFERLFEHRLRQTPGVDVMQAAQRALDAVFGADINPYAVAIARMRLTLAFLEKAGIQKLKDAPAPKLHLAVADSLLHNPQFAQQPFGALPGHSAEAWGGSFFAVDDDVAAVDVLHRQYSAVVGNPPYGTVEDRVLKGLYRELYVSASGKFTLAAPFMERFLHLARESGFVGLINSVAFANKLYGKSLIESVLRDVDVTHVLSTAGVYFPPPGFSVPTAIILARRQKAASHLQVLRQVAPDPGEYVDPSRGAVWSQILEHFEDESFDSEFIQVRKSSRAEVASYPWKLMAAGGDAIAVRIENSAVIRLGHLCESDGIGTFGMSNADDLFQVKTEDWIAAASCQWFRTHLTGEAIRDFMADPGECVFWPYDEELRLRPLPATGPIAEWLVPFRSYLNARATFGGGTYATDARRVWYQWHQITDSRVQSSRLVVFPELLTEMHALRVSGGVTISQSLMCFVPRRDLSDESVEALVAYLNSSSAAAWVKSRCAPVGTARGDVSKEKGKSERFRLPANMAAKLPVPEAVVASDVLRPRLASLYRRLEAIGQERVNLRAGLVDTFGASSEPKEWSRACDEWKQSDQRLVGRSVVLQEEIDWSVYALALGVETASETLSDIDVLDAGQALPAERPAMGGLPADSTIAKAWRLRKELLTTDEDVAAVETPRYKRSWLGRRGVFGRNKLDADGAVRLLRRNALFGRMVALFRETRVLSRREIALALSKTASTEEIEACLRSWSAPAFAAAIFTETGLERWRRLQQGQEGSCEEFSVADYLSPGLYSMRGGWSVPHEQIMQYVQCDSDAGDGPVYGWAGWNHLQRALALANLYQKRKTEEGWTAERLMPMLVGLHELLPWIQQWHNEVEPEYGQRMGDYFAQFLDGELATLGLTKAQLEAWRPQNLAGRRSSKAGSTSEVPGEPGGQAPAPRRARKPRAGTGAANEAEPSGGDAKPARRTKRKPSVSPGEQP